ncbi:MAG: Terminase small subunit [Akkermansiaceae bacterium]|nr:Terminase small subunit [Akkermansiaceae bacterium]
MVTTLNPRQLLFAQNVVTGMSLTDAYRQAGYSGEGHVAHAGASKLMQKPAIAGYVETRQQEHTLSAVADRTEILKKLTTVLRSETADLDSLPVHEVTRRTVLKSDGSRFTVVRSKSMSRHAALRQLARMLGLGKPCSNEDRYERYRQRNAIETRATVAAAIGPEDPTPSPADTPGGPPIRIGRHLNSRQRLFCEYLARDYPAYSAYGFAGYHVSRDPDQAGAAAARLLRRPAVIAYLRELRRYTTPRPLAGEVAGRDETLAYLTQALRATRPDIETQGRFIDQVIQDEVEKPDGSLETRIAIRSISQPRIIAQLAALLTSTTLPRENDDLYAAQIRAELAELFVDDIG